MSFEGQGNFFTIYFPGFDVLCFTRPRNQVSVYRTIGPLVSNTELICTFVFANTKSRLSHDLVHITPFISPEVHILLLNVDCMDRLACIGPH